MKKIILLLLVVINSFSLFAQIDEDQRVGRKISSLMKDADKELNKKNFKKAKRIYLEVIETKPDYCAPKRALSAIYYYESDYEKAANYLEQVIEFCPYFSRIMYYELGQFYYRIGNYDQAIYNFDKFKKFQNSPPSDFGINGFAEDNNNRKYKLVVDESIFQAGYARDSIPALEITNVINLGDSINSHLNDYFPFMTNDESVLLFTRMLTKNNEDFYVSYHKNGKWSEGKKVGNSFNTSVNEGMCTCTRDNVRMYFTSCQKENVQGTCDIQQAILKVTDTVEVVSIEPIKGDLNTAWWESQASISCDGRMMFFSSSRKKGYGKTDIYVSYIQPDGSWGAAKNVGGNINTEDYEESPFITNDGKTLFFSSTGMLGMGEQDIYMSRLQADGTWGRAMNLGNKVNTSARELGFFLTADGKTGYFASDRAGGKGLLDIYQFTLSQPVKSDPITFVEGFVKDSVTLKPVQTILEVADGQKIGTDKEGRFFRCLPPGAFDFDINTKDYLPYSKIEMIPEWDNRTFYQMDILLQKTRTNLDLNSNSITKFKPDSKPQIIVEKERIIRKEPIRLSVYFDFDQSNIKATEAEKLNGLLLKLKSQNNVSIQLMAYCDFKGTDDYNIVLSNKRAIAVYEFLMNNGVTVGNISYTGLGEIDDGRERWMNRRVDVLVIYKPQQHP